MIRFLKPQGAAWPGAAAAVLGLLLAACSSGGGNVVYDAGPDTPWDTVSDLEEEAHEDALPDAVDAADTPADTLPDTPPPPSCPQKSYIWIANSGEGTLSKLCTINGVEMARYYTSPQEFSGDPSRTSVNLHGDMVVTNRDPEYGPSSVTKFAADPIDCQDRDLSGSIDTSRGGDDVLAWGEDECMIWNTTLPDPSAAASIGARATAWDGAENPETGEGGTVWIGAAYSKQVFHIDGDTGEILQTGTVSIMPYGGAVDGRGSFWIVAMGCTVGLCSIARVNMTTLESQVYSVPCGYGISVDARGRIWTSGLNCVNRFDPAAEASNTLPLSGHFNRGIAVDNNGYVWAAVTAGNVVQVDENTMELVNEIHVGPEAVVGVAVDYFGYIWAISQGGNQALKIDPATYEVESFPVGIQPYTYSDMTGFQLGIVII
jgi:hypothetical protein